MSKKLDQLHTRIMENMNPAEKREFEASLTTLGQGGSADREALRESAKRLHPEYTDDQVEIFVTGSSDQGPPSLEASFVKLGLSRPAAKIAASGKVTGLGDTAPTGGGDSLEASIRFTYPDWTDSQVEAFLAGR